MYAALAAELSVQDAGCLPQGGGSADADSVDLVHSAHWGHAAVPILEEDVDQNLV